MPTTKADGQAMMVLVCDDLRKAVVLGGWPLALPSLSVDVLARTSTARTSTSSAIHGKLSTVEAGTTWMSKACTGVGRLSGLDDGIELGQLCWWISTGGPVHYSGHPPAAPARLTATPALPCCRWRAVPTKCWRGMVVNVGGCR